MPLVLEIHTMTVSDVLKIISCSLLSLRPLSVEILALMATTGILIEKPEKFATWIALLA